METFGLVQAGACPFRGRGKAVDRYATAFFTKKAELAELVSDEWVVLAEGQGVVDPDEEVEGVDREFTELEPAAQARWSMEAVADVASRVRKHEYERVVVFADRPMRDALKERGGLLSRMTAAGAETIEPLAGIGGQEQQERWLDEQLSIRRDAADPSAEDLDSGLDELSSG
ncbi:DUF6884 domain-containing protein [Halobaculum gomorrense]|uniref:DUF6884 domain-containing protein n=1 Tax=Halobaculum gomorrense TaxID=43928 RepID=A0A1M5RFQ0_9EURY|nr:DUF6884 domain-containing protein [Halobaculum gomorrense]SHH25202.1 hypothetical protein SAMN05443636_2181 [Halobaculum gomorrense]